MKMKWNLKKIFLFILWITVEIARLLIHVLGTVNKKAEKSGNLFAADMLNILLILSVLDVILFCFIYWYLCSQLFIFEKCKQKAWYYMGCLVNIELTYISQQYENNLSPVLKSLSALFTITKIIVGNIGLHQHSRLNLL